MDTLKTAAAQLDTLHVALATGDKELYDWLSLGASLLSGALIALFSTWLANRKADTRFDKELAARQEEFAQHKAAETERKLEEALITLQNKVIELTTTARKAPHHEDYVGREAQAFTEYATRLDSIWREVMAWANTCRVYAPDHLVRPVDDLADVASELSTLMEAKINKVLRLNGEGASPAEFEAAFRELNATQIATVKTCIGVQRTYMLRLREYLGRTK